MQPPAWVPCVRKAAWGPVRSLRCRVTGLGGNRGSAWPGLYLPTCEMGRTRCGGEEPEEMGRERCTCERCCCSVGACALAPRPWAPRPPALSVLSEPGDEEAWQLPAPLQWR